MPKKARTVGYEVGQSAPRAQVVDQVGLSDDLLRDTVAAQDHALSSGPSSASGSTENFRSAPNSDLLELPKIAASDTVFPHTTASSEATPAEPAAKRRRRPTKNAQSILDSHGIVRTISRVYMTEAQRKWADTWLLGRGFNSLNRIQVEEAELCVAEGIDCDIWGKINPPTPAAIRSRCGLYTVTAAAASEQHVPDSTPPAAAACAAAPVPHVIEISASPETTTAAAVSEQHVPDSTPSAAAASDDVIRIPAAPGGTSAMWVDDTPITATLQTELKVSEKVKSDAGIIYKDPPKEKIQSRLQFGAGDNR